MYMLRYNPASFSFLTWWCLRMLRDNILNMFCVCVFSLSCLFLTISVFLFDWVFFSLYLNLSSFFLRFSCANALSSVIVFFLLLLLLFHFKLECQFGWWMRWWVSCGRAMVCVIVCQRNFHTAMAKMSCVCGKRQRNQRWTMMLTTTTTTAAAESNQLKAKWQRSKDGLSSSSSKWLCWMLMGFCVDATVDKIDD